MVDEDGAAELLKWVKKKKKKKRIEPQNIQISELLGIPVVVTVRCYI